MNIPPCESQNNSLVKSREFKMEPANVEDQYRKFPDMKREEVLKLVEWIKQQPHIPNLTEGDAILFFHACRYSMELTKRTIDTSLTIRTHCPELFHNWDTGSPELKKAMKTVSIVPLPKLTQEGYGVIVAKLMDTDPSNFNFADVTKLYFMIFELWIVESGAEEGYIVVLDMKGATLGHVARMGIMTVKKVLVFLQEAAAIRLVGFHFINIVPFMDKLLALLSPFMKKELMEMMHLHSSLDTFYKHVPKKLLPSEYGGPEGDTNTLKEALYNKMKENRDFIMNLEKTHQVNEKLRPGKPKNASDLFGLEGNFKKLDID